MTNAGIPSLPQRGAPIAARSTVAPIPCALPPPYVSPCVATFVRTRVVSSLTATLAAAVALGLGVSMTVIPALAGQQVYVYTIVHPYYGDIGTLTDTIDRTPDVTRIESRLRIRVEILGIAVYSQASDTTEIIHGNRLVSLQSVSEKDGHHLEVHGHAQDGTFVVNGTAGLSTGPATTMPSDPWLLKSIGQGTLVYPVTGKIAKASVSGGDRETIAVNGGPLTVRHFWVEGENREDVWLDSRGIPVMFRSIEDGTAIDFVLRDTTAAPTVAPALPPDRSFLVNTEKAAK
jgi:hypothetical protein